VLALRGVDKVLDVDLAPAQLCTLKERSALRGWARRPPLGAKLQPVENEWRFSICPIPLRGGGISAAIIAGAVQALTHKVIHTSGEYLFGVFKKNDLGRFPAIRLENFEHYNSRNV
jgi:hypothetical protein